MEVHSPDGRVWKVRRRMRWPRRRRLWDAEEIWTDPTWLVDVAPSDGGGFVAGIVFAIVAGIVVTAVILLLAPLLVFIVEAAVVVLAAIALGRPWLVVAATSGPPAEEHRWLVRGLRASRRAVREVADELSRGVEAEPVSFEHELPYRRPRH